jgi:hypothetical protein
MFSERDSKTRIGRVLGTIDATTHIHLYDHEDHSMEVKSPEAMYVFFTEKLNNATESLRFIGSQLRQYSPKKPNKKITAEKIEALKKLFTDTQTDINDLKKAYEEVDQNYNSLPFLTKGLFIQLNKKYNEIMKNWEQKSKKTETFLKFIAEQEKNIE